MSLNTMGPGEDDFLSIYMDKSYRKAKTLISRARAVGISLEALTQMVREDFDTIEFHITLRENNGTTTKIGR